MPPVAEVIADPGSESGAGPIRNPVSVWHWIPGRARDDNLHVIADLIRARDDKWRPRMTNLLQADLFAVVA